MEFVKWPSTPRLFREVIVTEKVDGTNAAIQIKVGRPEHGYEKLVMKDGIAYSIAAQSRKRIIVPENDNFSFAFWVWDNGAQLIDILGPGIHFGEWWGKGIQRGYGSEWREFSLFNVKKHQNVLDAVGPAYINTVPVLYEGVFSEAHILNTLWNLEKDGSQAAPGFKNPEGICVFHTQSRQVYKVTLDHNDSHKWEAQ